MAGIKAKGGKKNRKLGRNKAYATLYLSQGRELKNKLRRLRARLKEKRHANDVQGLRDYVRLGGSVDAVQT